MSIVQLISNGILTIGALLGALVIVQFFWGLVGYVFYGGDDQHRTHSKVTLLNATISIIFLCIAWWLFEMLGSYLGL